MSTFSHDEVQRSLRDAEVAQREAVPAYRELLARLFGGDRDLAGIDRAEVVAPFSRRGLLRFGGLTIASGAVLSACSFGNKHKVAGSIAEAGTPTPGAAAPDAVVDDIVLTRTASSLEHVAANVYQTVISAGILKDAALLAAAKQFRDHHLDHAQLFETTTVQLGGEAYATSNPVVDAAIKSRRDGLKSESDVILFAHDLENLAAATYQTTVALLSTPKLRQAAVSVGGVEQRHAAVLAGIIASQNLVPVSGITPLPVAASTAPVTTAAKGAATTVAAVVAGPVYQVPAAFGLVAGAIGANSYMYYVKKTATTTTAKP